MAQDLQEYRLGETTDALALTTSTDHREAALAMTVQARRSLCILTEDLEHAVYNTPAMAEAVTRLATRNRHSSVCILLQDPTAVVHRTHRLVELSRRLSTSVQIRRPHEEHRRIARAFLVVDATGYVRRTRPGRYEGTARFNASGEARELLRLFDVLWERSTPDPELQRLHL